MLPRTWQDQLPVARSQPTPVNGYRLTRLPHAGGGEPAVALTGLLPVAASPRGWG